MVVLDVLLGCNLVVLFVFALRPRQAPATGIDELLRAVGLGDAATARPSSDGVIVPFASRDELAMRRARAAHPSAEIF